MTINKPFTFIAGTKARASEVNQDFDVLYSQVNSNTSGIYDLENDITQLKATKADINGSASQRFAVADAVNGADAINLNKFKRLTDNTKRYIWGLRIMKDSSNPKDTVIVTAGSAYDSKYEVVIILPSDTSIKNTAQAANATYYVHLISNKIASNYKLLITSTKVDPPLPSGYERYRCLGSYSTNSAGDITTINSYSNSIDIDDLRKAGTPDYAHPISLANSGTISGDGWLYVYGDAVGGSEELKVTINGFLICINGYLTNREGGHGPSGMYKVNRGDKYSIAGRTKQVSFLPSRGVN